jgi:hypothetical protein
MTFFTWLKSLFLSCWLRSVVEILCVSASIPAPNGETSVLEYAGYEFAPAMVKILKVLSETGALPAEIAGNREYAAMFRSILELVPNIGALLKYGVISSFENTYYNKRGVKRPVHSVCKEGVKASDYTVFVDFFNEVHSRMAVHHQASDIETLVKSFNAAMRKKFPEHSPKMVWHDRTYEQLLTMHLAADFLSCIGLLASSTEKRTIYDIESEIDDFHDARTREGVLGWTQTTFDGVHLGFVTEGDKQFMEEALGPKGLCVIGPDNGTLLVFDPEVVDVVSFENPHGIRVGETEKPVLRNETLAAIVRINGVGKVGVIGTHFKSGTNAEEQAIQAEETVNFINFLRHWIQANNLTKVMYFGDFNIPGGISIDLGLDEWRHERTVPANEANKTRVPHTYQVDKLETSKKVDYDQGGVLTCDQTTHLEMGEIRGNEMIPNRVHRSDHPVLRWTTRFART